SQRPRVGDRHACGAKLPHVSREVVRLEAVVDEAAALLEALIPAMLRVRLVECDQLEVGAGREGDERIMRGGGRPAARNDGEAESAIARDRGVEIRNDDHQVIDTFENGACSRSVVEMPWTVPASHGRCQGATGLTACTTIQSKDQQTGESRS